jgi:hypothetical protein
MWTNILQNKVYVKVEIVEYIVDPHAADQGHHHSGEYGLMEGCCTPSPLSRLRN